MTSEKWTRSFEPRPCRIARTYSAVSDGCHPLRDVATKATPRSASPSRRALPGGGRSGGGDGGDGGGPLTVGSSGAPRWAAAVPPTTAAAAASAASELEKAPTVLSAALEAGRFRIGEGDDGEPMDSDDGSGGGGGGPCSASAGC